MQHRGTVRSRFVPVSAERDLPPTGSALSKDGRRVGEMGSGSDGHGLALLRLDKVTAGDVLEASGDDGNDFTAPTVGTSPLAGHPAFMPPPRS